MYQPISDIPKSVFENCRLLAFDVDGTVTRDHQFDANFIRTCQQLQQAGVQLVAVTGRSLAFGRILVDFFGLDAAIAEGGSVCMYRLKQLDEHQSTEGTIYFEDESSRRQAAEARLENTIKELKGQFSDLEDAEDQTGRKYDRAFQLNTLNAPQLERADDIIEVAQKHGISASRSNVHINMWVGSFHKQFMFKKMIERLYPAFGFDTAEAAYSAYLYIGDSLNDAPMFQACPYSIGVAQVTRVEDQLKQINALPKYITQQTEVDGFYELTTYILDTKFKEPKSGHHH